MDHKTITRINKAVGKFATFLNREEKEDCSQSIALKILRTRKIRNLKWMVQDYLYENGMSTWRKGKRSAIATGEMRFFGELSDIPERGYEITDDLHSIDLKKVISRCKPVDAFVLKALGRGYRSKEIANELEVTESRASQMCKEAIENARRKLGCFR